jgi:hypothetical protein
MGIGFASYWYGLKYWSLKEQFKPNARIWVPYKVKIPILAMGSFWVGWVWCLSAVLEGPGDAGVLIPINGSGLEFGRFL